MQKKKKTFQRKKCHTFLHHQRTYVQYGKDPQVNAQVVNRSLLKRAHMVKKMANKMSVTLTLMRTSASMIDVKVCKSASAIFPRCKCLCDTITDRLFWRKAEQGYRTEVWQARASTWCSRARGVFLHTRRFSAVCLKATSPLHVAIRWEEGGFVLV